MAWVQPQHSRSKVDAAGAILIDPKADFFSAFEAQNVISNWRSSHSFPLNTLQNALRRNCKRVDATALVAQRIKRISSIRNKLLRYPTKRLSQMQDIGGCRGVVSSISQVYRVVEEFKRSEIKHTLFTVDDYITTPKDSGYRGVHLIYRYFSDKNETFNGLKIEVQVRTALQHAWATAVETVGTFINQALKSSQGEKDWLDFFILMGSAIAIREGCVPVWGAPENARQLRREIARYVEKLDVERHLHAYGATLKTLDASDQDAHYYLLVLNPEDKLVYVTGYKSDELETATHDYLVAEQGGQGKADAVLVSAESLVALKRAYPNYFLDTKVFLSAVRKAVG